ncbi:MAG: hypothetical protein Mars2KO_41630 [Maribacter sp.]
MPDEIDTSYVAKFEVDGVGGRPANPERKIRLALKDGQPILSVILCEGCYPASFVLMDELSDRFGELVFKNKFGVYIMVYNEQGFVIAEPSSEENKRFSFIDFYTRSKIDYETITKTTIEAYAMRLMEII